MRKEFIVILSLSWLMACNSGMESDAMKSSESVEMEESVAAEEMEFDEATPKASDLSFDYQEIVSEKLQEYVELRQLINTHPEFETDLRSQLKLLSGDSILDIGNSESVRISEIRILDSAHDIRDSTEYEIRFSFKLTTETETRIDSLLARFQKKTVEIEGESFTSTKVTFEILRD